MENFHLIAADGEVDLILRRPEQTTSYADFVFKHISTPPQLNSRRSNVSRPQCSKLKEMSALEKANLAASGVYHKQTSEKEPLYQDSNSDIKIKEASTASDRDTLSISYENCVRIRVSSKHLTHASSYFKRNLTSGMTESHTLSSEGRVDLVMKDADSEAMLIIMNIIHVRTRQVPRSIDLHMLTRIAVLVDYLECHEAIEPFSDVWIEKLQKNMATVYSKQLIQWLCISLVFRKEEHFTALTRRAIRQAQGPIETLGLPIRESVVGGCSVIPRSGLITDAYS